MVTRSGVGMKEVKTPGEVVVRATLGGRPQDERRRFSLILAAGRAWAVVSTAEGGQPDLCPFPQLGREISSSSHRVAQ